MSLAKRLGYGDGDRLLIINADDYGLCHSSNQAIQQLLSGGAVSSATLMLPCGWAREAALWSARHPHLSVGIHFTFTSEWDNYRWGPVYRSGSTRSLVTSEGYFPKDAKTLEQQADPSEVRAELIAQVEMALQLGMNPTHADNHMGSLYGLQTGRDFISIVLDVCAQYGLPFRLPRTLLLESGQVAPPELAELARLRAAEADSKGVVVLDYLIGLPFALGAGETYESFKGQMQALLSSLHPGVTELIIHPAEVTEELRAFHREPLKRGMEAELFRDPDVQETLREQGIQLIHWGMLQGLQRAGG
ncbi:polysaccharide deacetylase family protein [Paenibacillus sp. GCM10023252]|uniref:polysaccharide deacetylase family protein n=1 Tax=Paenibacillus sp. GCM10023252 TaxID=3252649 RepID=UPI00361A2BC5